MLCLLTFCLGLVLLGIAGVLAAVNNANSNSSSTSRDNMSFAIALILSGGIIAIIVMMFERKDVTRSRVRPGSESAFQSQEVEAPPQVDMQPPPSYEEGAYAPPSYEEAIRQLEAQGVHIPPEEPKQQPA